MPVTNQRQSDRKAVLHLAAHERVRPKHPHQQVAVGDDAVDAGAGEGVGELAGGGLAGRRVTHDLGQHRVVEGGDGRAGLVPRVDADPFPCWDLEEAEHAGLRLVVGDRVLGVQPHLDRMTGRLTGCCGLAELHRHQVDAPHQLGDRVLDLEPGVHLQEPEAAGIHGVDQELHGPGALVVDRLRRPSPPPRASRRGCPRAGAVPVPPRPPSGGDAGASSPARRWQSCRTPAPRRDVRARRTARRTPCRPRTPTAPRPPRPRPHPRGRRDDARRASRGRRRRRTPSPAGAGRPRSARRASRARARRPRA